MASSKSVRGGPTGGAEREPAEPRVRLGVAASAILDRFLHHAITIPITGRSYRVKDSLPPQGGNKKNRKSNEPPTAGAAS
jgi:hypothetical protein